MDDTAALLQLLAAVRDGQTSPEEALRRIGERELSVGDAATLLSADGPAFARIDHHRAQRCGFPEVVYAPGKTADQVVAVALEILRRSKRLLITRVDATQRGALREALSDAVFHDRARAVTVVRDEVTACGRVAILSAGTADEPVAEEARVTAETMGVRAEAHYDCGVAGLHRLLGALPALRAADAIVVAAGMEGALPSVVGGLVDVPLIAVPTSVGYGASFEGVAPLLTMLNSCAAGVGVVNIDNGFGAGYLAATIARRAARGAVGAGSDTGSKTGSGSSPPPTV